MIWFNYTDLWSVLTIVIFLALNITISYPCFFYIFKKHDKIIPFFITTSISVYIILGYLFYCFHLLNYYPVVYCCLFLLLDSVILFKNHTIPRLPKINIFIIIFFLLLLSLFSYYFFNFGLHNIIPDNPNDVANHHLFFETIRKSGHIVMSYYSPGFHIFLYSIYLFLGFSHIYRFAGPIIGLIITLNLYLVSASIFKQKISRIVILLLVLSPLFKLLTLQFIFFWPTTLSYLFLPTLIILLTRPKQLSTKETLVLYGVNIFALSLTLPYLFLQYLPVVLLLAVCFLFRFKPPSESIKSNFYFQTAVITTLGIFISLFHIFLFTQILSKTKTDTFPTITLITKKDNIFQVSNVVEKAKTVVQKTPTITPILTPTPTITIKPSAAVSETPAVTVSPSPQPSLTTAISPIPVPAVKLFNLQNSRYYVNYFLPLIYTIQDAFSFKSPKALDVYSLKSYAILIFSLFLCLFSLVFKKQKLLVLSLATFVFGVISMFGVLQLTHYPGRAGPCFVFASLILVTFLFDSLITLKSTLYKAILIVVLFLIDLYCPPPVYQIDNFCKEVFEQSYLISQKEPNKKIYIITLFSPLSVVSSNIDTFPLELDSLSLTKGYNTYLILQHNLCDSTSTTYLKANKNDITAQYIEDNKKTNRLNNQLLNDTITQSPLFSEFKPYFENYNIAIYFRAKNTSLLF